MILIAAGCDNSIPKPPKGVTSNGNDPAPNKDIGSDLYKAEKYSDRAAATPVDLLLIPGILNAHIKVDLPSQKDGKIHGICTELGPGERPTQDMIAHPVDKTKFYRILRDSEHVKKDQLVMVLDDRDAFMTVKIQESQVEAAKAEVGAAEKTTALAKQYWERQLAIAKKDDNVVTTFEVKKAELDFQRSEAEVEKSKANLRKAENELGRAKVLLEMHYLRATIDGIIIPTNRKPGEAVRASETVIQIQNVDRLRVEGLIDAGFRGMIQEGMQVAVEPSVEINEQGIRAHFQPFTGVAVANSPQQDPYFVSCSEDRTARVWQGRQQIALLPHPVAVRSVVCTPVGVTSNLCLTGADDGKLRLWDLNSRNRQPLREFESSLEKGGFQHRGHITALAFSPDGHFAASADDQDICLWEVATGNLKYRFPPAHRGAITTLAFTPQCRLISSGRDGTMRIWKLGASGAQEDFRQDGRSGDVGVLGVTKDGERMLFDYQQSLTLLSLNDKRVDGVIQPPAQAGRFTTFALFSPDDAYILTGANAESRLSLFRAPSAENFRCAEIRQFRPENRFAVFTCAAFSPHPQSSFAVTGTRGGDLYVWRMPAKNDVKPLSAVVKFVDHSTDASSRQIRVWAELDNPRDANGEVVLLPGKSATIIVRPGQIHRTNKRPIQ
jgi:WD40 repeat protein